MMGDQIAGTIWYLLALVLVGSSLMIRRLPNGRRFALAAIWAGIIVALTALIAALRGAG
jgi:aspartyl protease family protein